MKKIKNVGKVLTREEQKAIKGGAIFCSGGPCMDVYGNFQGYCKSNGVDQSCECTYNLAPCS
jgi:hypothetical protein